MASIQTMARRIASLHDAYRDRVNAALDGGHQDIAKRISDEHTRLATRVVADIG